MSRRVTLSIVGPDSEAPLLTVDHAKFKAGETISEFIERSGIDVYSLPVVCKVNGKYVLGREWDKRRLKGRDRVEFLARPGRGAMGGGGRSGAKSIGSIVALVALSVLAPWAGGAMAGALGLGASTIGGVSFSSVFSGIILAGGSFLISQFLKPNVGGQSEKKADIYTISASGNTARPQQLIPVGYGRVIQAPDYAAPPYSEYDGDEMYLYQLFCLGCGEYDLEEIWLDDTRMWQKGIGFHSAFAGCKLEIVPPGEPVDLFPINVVTASEVSSIKLPSPSKDPFNNGWVGFYVANPPGTIAREIWLDIVFPNGGSQSFKDRTIEVSVQVVAEARRVDDAGVEYGPIIDLLNKTYTFNKNDLIRYTEKIPVDPGRWAVRVRRRNDSITGVKQKHGEGHDDVQWEALRSKIDGPDRFAGVTTIALKARATANMAALSGRRIKTVQTRKIPVWTGTQWRTQTTRNPVWAALDIWQNTDYGPGLNIANVDFQTFYQYALFYDQQEHTFDHFFTDRTSVAEAIETALKVGRANPSFVGDRMTMVRDEPREVPRMAFTDAEIVRGSLAITRRLLDEEWADGVVIEYLDERNWRPSDVSSAPDGVKLQRPARVQIPGLTKRKQAVGLARHLAMVNNRRRMDVSFQVELEGRMLKRMDQITVSSELPEQWGQSLKIEGYDPATRRMTFSSAPKFAASGNHYIGIRRATGRPWGPVRVTAVSGQPNTVTINQVDLNAVEAQQGSIAAALERTDDMDKLSAVFSQGTPRQRTLLVTRGRMRGKYTTIDAVIDDPLVYTVNEDGIPPIPPPLPNFEAVYPLIKGMSARAYQRGGTIVLQVGWQPTKGAVTYLIEFSADGGTSWTTIYNGPRTSCEAIVGGLRHVLVRGSVVGASGTPGTATVIEVEAPPLRMANEFFIMEVSEDDFIPQVRRELEFQPLIQPVAIQAANTVVVAQQANERAEASIKRIEEVRVSMEEAFAAFGIEVNARFEENEAWVSQQLQALSGPGGAIATLREELVARIEDNEGRIVNLQQTRITADEATAIASQAVSAKVGDIGSATVQQIMEAQATQIGTLFSRYAIRLTAGGFWTGFEIVAANGTPGTVRTEFRIAADRFMIGRPGDTGAEYVFTVQTVNGVARVAMKGDFIADGSVNANKINVISLSALAVDIGTVSKGTMDFNGVKILGNSERIEIWD